MGLMPISQIEHEVKTDAPIVGRTMSHQPLPQKWPALPGLGHAAVPGIPHVLSDLARSQGRACHWPLGMAEFCGEVNASCIEKMPWLLLAILWHSKMGKIHTLCGEIEGMSFVPMVHRRTSLSEYLHQFGLYICSPFIGSAWLFQICIVRWMSIPDIMKGQCSTLW